MIFSEQSLYKLKLSNKNLSAIPNKSKFNAKITKVYRTKEPNFVDRRKNYLKNDRINSDLPDGIYKVYLEYKDTLDSKAGKMKEISYYLDIRNEKIYQQSSKYPRKMSGSVEPLNETLFRNNNFRLKDEDWNRLINFYIIENPSVTSKQAYTTVRYFNIKGIWGNNCWQKGETLKTKLIATIPDYDCLVMYVHTDKDMRRILEALNLHDLNSFPSETKVCIYDSCGNIFLSIFRHIRNALAHGRYFLYGDNKANYIFLEDSYKNKVTARMVFDVTILLNWINLIKDA
jgi:hypothetical protein